VSARGGDGDLVRWELAAVHSRLISYGRESRSVISLRTQHTLGSDIMRYLPAILLFVACPPSVAAEQEHAKTRDPELIVKGARE
jgi:hypothetical protein